METHGEQVVDRWLANPTANPRCPPRRSLLDRELREWGLDLLQHLGQWLSGDSEQDLALRYERLGRLSFEGPQISLYTKPYTACACFARRCWISCRRKRLSDTSVELYAQEEWNGRLGTFFDRLVVHTVRGFERGGSKSASAA